MRNALVLLLVSLAAAPAAARSPLERLVLPLQDRPGEQRGAVATAVALSADGASVAAGGDDHVVRVWDAASGEPAAKLVGHRDWVRAVRFGADHRRIASVADDHTMCLWTLTEQEPRPTSRRLAEGPLLSVAMHPDGVRLATAGFGDGVRVFGSAADSQEPQRLGCPCVDTRAVAFSPDGRWLAAAGRDGVVRMWDLRASGGPRDLPSDGRRVRALAFSPDGKTLAAGGDGPAVRLWRMDTPEVTAGAADAAPDELLVRPGKVYALAFVDDRLLAVGGTRNVVRLWDIDSRSPAYTLRGHTGTVASLASSADGRRLVSGSFDTTVRVWDLDPADATLAVAGAGPPKQAR